MRTINCDFCKANSDSKEVLIEGEGFSGKSVHICSDCVADCNEIIAEREAQKAKREGE